MEYLSFEAKNMMSSEVNFDKKEVAVEEMYGLREDSKLSMLPILDKLIEENEVDVAEAIINGVGVFKVTPKVVLDDNTLILSIHGGTHITQNGLLSTFESILLSAKSEISAVCVDYRMPPDVPLSTSISDCVDVYKGIIENFTNKQIVLYGSSSGGGLAFSVLNKIIEQGLKMPVLLLTNAPWLDLSKTGDSYYSNEFVDPILPTYDGLMMSVAKLCSKDTSINNPEISPIHSDYSDAYPPIFIGCGSKDILLSSSTRMNNKLIRSGCDVRLQIYDGIGHGLLLLPYEGGQLINDMLEFMRKHLKGK